MKARHLAEQDGLGPQDFHVPVKPIVDDEGVGHADAVGLDMGEEKEGRGGE